MKCDIVEQEVDASIATMVEVGDLSLEKGAHIHEAENTEDDDLRGSCVMPASLATQHAIVGREVDPNIATYEAVVTETGTEESARKAQDDVSSEPGHGCQPTGCMVVQRSMALHGAVDEYCTDEHQCAMYTEDDSFDDSVMKVRK